MSNGALITTGGGFSNAFDAPSFQSAFTAKYFDSYATGSKVILMVLRMDPLILWMVLRKYFDSYATGSKVIRRLLEHQSCGALGWSCVVVVGGS